jgi:hypothetical protein
MSDTELSAEMVAKAAASLGLELPDGDVAVALATVATLVEQSPATVHGSEALDGYKLLSGEL